MQQNDTLRYDADRKMFYTTDQNGVTRDAMSLDQVIQTMRANGGANPNNGAGFQAVGQLANQAATPPNIQSLQQILQQLQQLLSGMKPVAGLESRGAANGFSTGGANGGGYSAPSSNSISSGSGSGSASGGGSLEDSVAAAGSKIDDMFAQAEKLMASDKPSDQLKAQMMMQKAQRMFESISKLLEQRSKAQSTAISNIK
jgi:hypothetical protein